MRKLDVVDYTYGKRSSDDVNTSLPFTENFKECRTIQQANVVIGAYVNQNIKDTQAKQDTLVSGENIKTINGNSILGEGDLEIETGASEWGEITGDINDQTDLKNALDDKQDTLIGTETTGQNIKTINGNSILGTGNLSVTASASWGSITGSIANQTDLKTALDSMIPGNEVKQSGIVVGHEIIDDLYIGNYGNIKETDGTSSFYNCPTVLASEPTANNQLANKYYVDNGLSGKQDTLVSGTNIKTINSTSILGSGDINVNTIIGNSFNIQTETINVGSFAGGDEKYNQTYNVTIPSGYKCLGIVGWYLTGGGFTLVYTNEIWFDVSTNQIKYSLKNGWNTATADITLTVKLLLVKTS